MEKTLKKIIRALFIGIPVVFGIGYPIWFWVTAGSWASEPFWGEFIFMVTVAFDILAIVAGTAIWAFNEDDDL